ncbi:prepilin-type N-terminal cleavage/methylation domain-containing protein [Marinicauda salina]|nr:prepilin-type N-terminal cleavage/methylation domain-containing protein [Marinicauda salina]
MPTSPSADRFAHAAGFTLFETLVALAIASSVAATAAAFVRMNSPGPAMTAMIDRTAADLARARLEARRTGRPVDVRVNDEGYAIPALAVVRTWRPGVEARWSRAAETGFELIPGPAAAEPIRLELDYSGLEAEILVRSVSGRIDVRRG